jgi:precorrin-2 dehydrogenase/sirohydrochlorin ferrochelatase
MPMPNYYPIMLDVRDRYALVIGGNRIAAEKAAVLHAAGAKVTVLNPEFCEDLHDLAHHQGITLRYKAYEYGDLKGAFIVVATATYEPALAEAIWREGQENGQLVNIVDLPTHCNFIIPSILRRGKLTIAVSTEGAAPGLAKRIRQQLESYLPSAYETYINLATITRQYLRNAPITYEQRDDFFGEFFASDILNLLNENDRVEALASTVRLLRSYNIDISVSTIIQDLEKVEAKNASYTPNQSRA